MTAAARHTLWKDGAFIADPFKEWAEGANPAEARYVHVPLPEFLANRSAFLANPHPLGLLVSPGDKIEEDTLLEHALEAGADDVKRVDDKFEITCDPSFFAEVGTALQAHGIERTPPRVEEVRVRANAAAEHVEPRTFDDLSRRRRRQG